MTGKKTVKKKVVHIPHKYVAAVNEGVKFLDMIFGRKEWLRRMDMSSFDITDSYTCVAGNVFRDAMFGGQEAGYDSFIQAIEAMGAGYDVAEKTAARFGFYSKSSRGWGFLQDLWVVKINNLKRAQARK